MFKHDHRPRIYSNIETKVQRVRNCSLKSCHSRRGHVGGDRPPGQEGKPDPETVGSDPWPSVPRTMVEQAYTKRRGEPASVRPKSIDHFGEKGS
ncbi:hypothetical protein Pcinc_002333 [Petrolisthes cinctipes]|uniref:Uncharacterized protein n=1 Tax=Petrolisthes cinctipes TaxID=88211 RepID=A0AAE1GJ13_PETCI|nr:hypothetical protein Pcinc_002333 [Petrolisthes cinctipes]